MNLALMRLLLRKSLAQQQAFGGLCLEHHGLYWSSTGWKASGANLVVDAGAIQQRRMALMRWCAMRPVPVGWLLWPDQQPQVQGAALRSLGFVASDTLLQMELPTGWSCDPCTDGLPSAGRIRWASPADLEALTSFYAQCHQIPMGYARQVAVGFLAAQKSGDGCLWLAEAQNRPVAAVTACLEGRNALITWLGTRPEQRRRGWAEALLIRALADLQASGVVRVQLQAVHGAKSLYARRGFQALFALQLWTHPGVS